jgi:AcrR family transcriptional regulator
MLGKMSNMNDQISTKQTKGTRQRILEVAAGLFAERGFDGATIRDISSKLGIANPSLYYHFKSK